MYFEPPQCVVKRHSDFRYQLSDFDAFKADLPTKTGCTLKGPLDERKLGNGERNDELTRWAGKWASEGQDFETVVKLVMGHNVLMCQEPLPEKDVVTIVKSVFKKETKKLQELGIDPTSVQNSLDTSKAVFGQSLDTSLDSRGQAERPKSLQAMIDDFVNNSNGMFSNADIDREIGLTTRKERKHRSECIAKLRKDGRIVPYGGRDGYWKKAEEGQEAMNFMDIDMSFFPIVLPFGLDRMVRTMPKSLIVYAGSPNAGKSALALSTIWHNICRYYILYII